MDEALPDREIRRGYCFVIREVSLSLRCEDRMRLGIALAFRYLCHTKAEDGAFEYGRCRNIEDSYPAWKQAGLIYILYVR